ncbi:MAG: NAD(P)-binding oxidoreductase [Bacteroidia bacterium]
MSTLIIGASGATGRQLAEQLMEKGQKIRIIIRETSKIPDYWNNNSGITIIKANLSEMSVEEMTNHLAECHAVAFCLGHNLTWKGIYGKPRKLVTDAVRLVSEAIQNSTNKIPGKIVLMNTTGNRNRDISEPVSFGEKIVTGLIRLLLPPHSDNEKAADYLRISIGQNDPSIEWVAVRPDSLINESSVTEYTLHVSPTRSAIFNPGKTSRINVAHFMASLILDGSLWNKWKGKMPVIYNVENQKLINEPTTT